VTREQQESVVIEAPPVSGLKRGETPQHYVARTFVLDLGDF
jgi:RNA polymerase-associated protein RTF1